MSAILSPRAREALENLLVRIGSWTPARWDQHLRYDVGDEVANEIIAWLEARNIKPYRGRP